MPPKKRQKLEVAMSSMLEEQQQMQREVIRALNTVLSIVAGIMELLRQQQHAASHRESVTLGGPPLGGMPFTPGGSPLGGSPPPGGGIPFTPGAPPRFPPPSSRYDPGK